MQEENCSIHVNEYPSGGSHGEAVNFEVWSSLSAVRYAGRTGCSIEASGETVCAEVSNTLYEWIISDPWEGLS